jgi:hypothetical protein
MAPLLSPIRSDVTAGCSAAVAMLKRVARFGGCVSDALRSTA